MRSSLPALACGVALLLTMGPPATAAANPAAVPVSRMDTAWWRERFALKQSQLHHGPVDLVWLGDSITQNWELAGPPDWTDFRPAWQRFYGDRHAVDLGFRGDSTAHLLWRMTHGEMDGISPKLAIVLIGANNFGHVHQTAEQTFGGIEAVIALLHQRWPATRVILLPVLPSIRSAWITEQTRRLDAALARRYGDGREVTYIDVTSIFLTNGEADSSNFLDRHLTPPDPPLHPTAQAQAKIAERIEPEVAKTIPPSRQPS